MAYPPTAEAGPSRTDSPFYHVNVAPAHGAGAEEEGLVRRSGEVDLGDELQMQEPSAIQCASSLFYEGQQTPPTLRNIFVSRWQANFLGGMKTSPLSIGSRIPYENGMPRFTSRQSLIRSKGV